MKKPQDIAIEDLMKVLDEMDVEQLKPKQPELPVKPEVEVEVAEVDPEKAKLFNKGYESQTIKPQDKQIKIEKKAVKVGQVDPDELDDEQKKMLEKLYSQIG